jgi:hypothetical protein
LIVICCYGILTVWDNIYECVVIAVATLDKSERQLPVYIAVRVKICTLFLKNSSLCFVGHLLNLKVFNENRGSF